MLSKKRNRCKQRKRETNEVREIQKQSSREEFCTAAPTFSSVLPLPSEPYAAEIYFIVYILITEGKNGCLDLVAIGEGGRIVKSMAFQGRPEIFFLIF